MNVRISQILTGEVIAALRAAGFEIVMVGGVPSWMERVPSMPAELYRIKETD